MQLVRVGKNVLQVVHNNYIVYDQETSERIVFKHNPLCGKAIATCGNSELTNFQSNQECVKWIQTHRIHVEKDIVQHRKKTKLARKTYNAARGYFYCNKDDVSKGGASFIPKNITGCYFPSTEYYTAVFKTFNGVVQLLNDDEYTPEKLDAATMSTENVGIGEAERDMVDPLYYGTRYKRLLDTYAVHDTTHTRYAINADIMGNTFYDIPKTFQRVPLVDAIDLIDLVMIDPYKNSLISIEVSPFCNATANCKNPYDYDLQMAITQMHQNYALADKPQYVLSYFASIWNRIDDGRYNCSQSLMRLNRIYGGESQIHQKIDILQNGKSPEGRGQIRSLDDACTVLKLGSGANLCES